MIMYQGLTIEDQRLRFFLTFLHLSSMIIRNIHLFNFLIKTKSWTFCSKLNRSESTGILRMKAVKICEKVLTSKANYVEYEHTC